MGKSVKTNTRRTAITEPNLARQGQREIEAGRQNAREQRTKIKLREEKW